jgi:hypothetical protein
MFEMCAISPALASWLGSAVQCSAVQERRALEEEATAEPQRARDGSNWIEEVQQHLYVSSANRPLQGVQQELGRIVQVFVVTGRTVLHTDFEQLTVAFSLKANHTRTNQDSTRDNPFPDAP